MSAVSSPRRADRSKRGGRRTRWRSNTPSLLVHRVEPHNAEVPLGHLGRSELTPNATFYVRNHFAVPRIDRRRWRLRVHGLVEHPIELRWDDLRRFSPRSQTLTLECAGNGRTLFEPEVDGEPWRLGAVSTAAWTGVRLLDLLREAKVLPTATELVFRGADRGSVPTSPATVPFERSLSVADAVRADPLLAFRMNGSPLPPDHGFPVRLVVPGWYAVASVKWLTEIEAIRGTFQAHFQTESYFFEQKNGRRLQRVPVGLQRVRAVITEPVAGQRRRPGPLAIRGVAWSGSSRVARVDVSLAGGPWKRARLLGRGGKGCWRRWEFVARALPPGAVEVRVRARDVDGATQPDRAEWNRLGYGNNSVHRLLLSAPRRPEPVPRRGTFRKGRLGGDPPSRRAKTRLRPS